MYPEHRVSLEEMLALARRVYGREPYIGVIERMIGNTEIAQRRFALPLERVDAPLGLQQRAALYMEHALPLARGVVSAALDEADIEPADIDLIITTSCTGFIMPSLDVYVINELGFPPRVRRMPLAQLGCVAGVSALARANDHCRAYPHARVLIVAVELSSLCFFPERKDLTSAVCASIFGDGAAACVVSGAELGEPGLQLEDSSSYTMAHSEHYIRYEVTDDGYHLTLDRGVMHAIPELAPIIERLARGPDNRALDFVIAHTGGRRILDGLAAALELDDAMLAPSRASLGEVGNTASVSVLDVLRRSYARDHARLGARDNHGVVLGFGPGFTMELLTASWGS